MNLMGKYKSSLKTSLDLNITKSSSIRLRVGYQHLINTQFPYHYQGSQMISNQFYFLILQGKSSRTCPQSVAQRLSKEQTLRSQLEPSASVGPNNVITDMMF